MKLRPIGCPKGQQTTVNLRYIPVNLRYITTVNLRYITTVNLRYITTVNQRYITTFNLHYITTVNLHYVTTVNLHYITTVNLIYITTQKGYDLKSEFIPTTVLKSSKQRKIYFEILLL